MSVDNPAAFPRTGEGFGNANYDTPGMSLRDYFAGQALAGMGTWTPYGYNPLGDNRSLSDRSAWAYRQADAMLAERARTISSEKDAG